MPFLQTCSEAGLHEPAVLNVRDYPSIQAAVDAAAPFDTVYIPPGRYETGTIFLKSHLTLHLAPQAVLLASPDVSRYPGLDWAKISQGGQRCLVGGCGLEDVTIEGSGIIEGNGHFFWEDFRDEAVPHAKTSGIQFFKPRKIRPKILYFVRCRDLRIRDITICNAPFYTVHVLGCDQVEIHHLTVRNNRQGPNTDVLDIDCCAGVRITNCDLDAGDDAIAVKSDIAMLGEDKACERIQITGNRLSSTCCGIRAGYEGDGEIRDLVFTDNIIYDTRKAIDILSFAPNSGFGIRHGARISSLIFSNCILRNTCRAIHIWSGTGGKCDYTGFIRDLLFSGIYGECSDASFAGGLNVGNLTFRDIHLTIRRDPAEYAGRMPDEMTSVWGHGYLEKPFTFYRVTPVCENVVLKE